MTFFDFLYYVMMMQGLGLGIGAFVSMLYHWPSWN